MNRLGIFGGAALTLVLGCGEVFAQSPPPGGPGGPGGPGPNGRGGRGGPDQMFEALDTDGNGLISAEELAASPMGERMGDLSEADTSVGEDGTPNKDGISKEELTKFMAKRRVDRTLERFDTDKDGKISAEEMAGNRMEEALKKLDTDGDGAVSRDELEKGIDTLRGGRGGRGQGGQGGQGRGGRGGRGQGGPQGEPKKDDPNGPQSF